MRASLLSTVVAALVSFPWLAACGGEVAPARTAASRPPAAPVSTDELDRELPLDHRVTKGRLPNGLTYYILPNKSPAKRAQIWLAVNAGSVLEDDDQRGLAHLLEHMAFNGTKRFPKQELVDFIEKSGVRFGADLNAYTSFDETVYTLALPTDRPEILHRGLSVLRDWAGDLTLDPQEIDKERPVVLEEWRLRRGAGRRIQESRAPVLYQGSRYADRAPIGKAEIIKSAPHDAVVRFYKDWYRPDLMAVIAVGDFKTAEIEARIKAEFASLPARPSPRPRPAVTMPAHAQTLVSIETDPEMPATTLSVTTKMPHRPQRTARDYRRVLAERLYNMMLNARLEEVRRRPDAPFLTAASSSYTMVRPTDAFTQTATVKEDGVDEGLAALYEEVLRVARHGFVPAELERARTTMLRASQQAVSERTRIDSKVHAQRIVKSFLNGEAMAGVEADVALVERFLPTLTLEELNGIGSALSKGSRIISITGPADMVKPLPEAVLAVSTEVEKRAIAPYVDSGPGEPLMVRTPAPGTVVKTESVPPLGLVVWTLGNGARVVLKPMPGTGDRVLMNAVSRGGTSVMKPEQLDAARLATSVVGASGYGALDAVKLRRSLTGKIVSAAPHIGELHESVSGSSTFSDLEPLLQLVHLVFTAPRRDDATFAAWRAARVESARHQGVTPESAFAQQVALVYNAGDPRRRPATADAIGSLELDRVLAAYKDRFGDAGDFTFVFTGNVPAEKLKPLVETYLASLPAAGRKETWKDVPIAHPTGIVRKVVTKGTEPKSSVSLVFHGAERWSRETDSDMRALGEILRIRLREVLREEMGGVYSVHASGSVARAPRPRFEFRVDFSCAPENVEKLEKAVFDEVAAIQEKGVPEDYIAKIKEQRRRTAETTSRSATWWLAELSAAYTYGEDPKGILEVPSWTEKLGSERIKAAARKYLPKDQYVLMELRPEK